jgi:hypothetical protein
MISIYCSLTNIDQENVCNLLMRKYFIGHLIVNARVDPFNKLIIFFLIQISLSYNISNYKTKESPPLRCCQRVIVGIYFHVIISIFKFKCKLWKNILKKKKAKQNHFVSHHFR